MTSEDRPRLTYEFASRRTKRRRAEQISNNFTTEECMNATKRKLKEEGNHSAVKIMKMIHDENDAEDILSKAHNSEPTELPVEKALSLFIETNMTKENYNIMRSTANMFHKNFFPEYRLIAEMKKEAYPEGIIITESLCVVPLKNLLYHTVERLFKFTHLSFNNNSRKKLTLRVKYGFDGTNTNSYRQSSSDYSIDYSKIFVSSMVPLQLVDKRTNEEYWKNPCPSSVRFCHPIRLVNEKETADTCVMEEARIKQEIKNLKSIQIAGCTVDFDMYLTMIDGKVCNALNETSSQRCFICKSTISQLNDIDYLMEKNIDESALEYGFSVLHARIRFMEVVLHISYRLELQIWKVSKALEPIICARKERIQQEIERELHIVVDKPTQGAGNTNNGNTARTFFSNVENISRITGFDRELLNYLSVILGAISSQYNLNAAKFRDYCRRAAFRYKELYDWYYMPPSLHVILLHGYQVIERLIVPIGILSEEAQESAHKIIKLFKEKFSRKTSRIDTNTDMFRRLFLYSDIYLSSIRKLRKRKQINLTEEMKELIVNNEIEHDDSGHQLSNALNPLSLHYSSTDSETDE